jgi:hypothetical protein
MFEGCTIKYKKNKNTGVVNQVSVTYPADEKGNKLHKSIPLDEKNYDYELILAWVAAGNTIEEAD